MHKNDNIFLIGYMGVGKSSIGKKLTKKMNLSFIDTDDAIALQENKSINDIFESFGEAYFRKLENEFLNKVQENSGIVFSTGGGMPCFHGNIDIMNSLGITVYLQRPSKELFQRLMNAKKERPKIKHLTDEELLQQINMDLLEREKYYLKADIVLDRNEQGLDSIIDAIKKLVK